MSDEQRRLLVLDRVNRNPGVHFNGLVRELSMAPNTIQNHLLDLCGEGRLIRTELFGRVHYYPPKYDGWERGALAMFRRETARGMLFYLLEYGPSYPEAVATDLGIARSTLEYHLNHLIESDIVVKNRSGRRIVLELVRPEETEALLDEIEPKASDRLVDRAERLLDHFLEFR